jgi:hypothetical protein
MNKRTMKVYFHVTSRGLREDGAMCPPRKDGEDVVVLVGTT